MSALVAGYGSSDDEDQQPVASTSRAALDNGRPALPHQEQDGNNDDDDDEEDDDALEAAARADVFGVKTAVSTQQARHQEAQDSQRQLQVAAAPDVVAVVSLNPCSCRLEFSFTLGAVGQIPHSNKRRRQGHVRQCQIRRLANAGHGPPGCL